MSGKYDPDKTALVFFQTGGGCRASNYVSLLRKALKKAGYPQVPVVALSFTGLEHHPGLTLSVPLIHKIVYAFLYADLLMLLRNQCRPYEIRAGESEALAMSWTERLAKELDTGAKISYRRAKENYRLMIEDFKKIPRAEVSKPRVGIVGEIFVKYSPLGNNHLEDFLVKEGAEVTVPGLLDFCMYCVYNNMMDATLLGRNKKQYRLWRAAYKLFLGKQKDMIRAVESHSDFTPPTPFDHTVTLIKGYIGIGAKMGEGWLLTAEMLELAEKGIQNIVCTQPFGCLPNHICGKGMMRPLKEKNPDINIVAIDYDAGATAVNQENRIKLMMANSAK
jgi:predicted nucleotide-binding protein (sugar kinase/HSP70/actin superfamily)